MRAKLPALPAPAWIALAAAIGCGVALRVVHHSDIDSRSPDERTYTAYAAQVADYGLGAFPAIFSDYVEAGNLWINPAPTRTGEILLVAAMMRIERIRDERAGADLSLVCSILALFVTAWIGVRFFDPWIAAAAVAFLAASVPELGIARRAWTDSLAGLMSLLLVLITCFIYAPKNRRRVRLYLLFLTIGCGALLVKEALAVYFAICGVGLVAMLWFQEKSRTGAILLAAGGLLSVALALLLLLAASGSRATLAVMLPTPGNWLAPSADSWVMQNYGGHWYQFFSLLWQVGPLTAIMALAGLIAVASRAVASRAPAPLLVAAIAAICVSFLAFGSGLQCLRLISPADGCYALLAAIGLTTLLAWARNTTDPADYRALVAIAVLAIAVEGVRNYGLHVAIVVRSGMEDLAASGFRYWLQ